MLFVSIYKQQKQSTKAIKRKMTTTNNTSLFVPHIFANISEERIRSVIENAAKYGQVDQIDLIPKKSADGKAYNSAYIHMKSWNEDEKTQKFLAHLKDATKQTHIIYDKPWFWIVLENTSSDKKKTKTQTPPNSPDLKEFPPLVSGVPLTDAWLNLREPTLTPPPRRNKPMEAPGAPHKKRKAVLRNLEQEFAQPDLDFPTDDENMNLVDADYVYHMEQENMQLRNNNDWLQQKNYMLQQEVERLRVMMMGMVGMGMM